MAKRSVIERCASWEPKKELSLDSNLRELITEVDKIIRIKKSCGLTFFEAMDLIEELPEIIANHILNK